MLLCHYKFWIQQGFAFLLKLSQFPQKYIAAQPFSTESELESESEWALLVKYVKKY